MRFCKVGVSFGAVLLLLLGFLLLPLTASALTPTEGNNLQISPLPIELTTKPGTSTSADLRVRNAGSQPERLQIRLLKVTEDDNGGVHLTPPGKTDDWANWVSFSRNVFDAPPNQWQTINMTINVPKNAAFGYYFAVEYMRANENTPQPGQTAAQGAVATFILLNADAPGASRAAQVVSFTADRKSYEFLPANFTVKVRSTGNVHVAPHGNIFISRGSKQIGSIDINSAQGNILPNSSRYFSSSWNDGFPVYVDKTNNGKAVKDKQGNQEKTLAWNLGHIQHLRFGHYTAHLVMVYDNGKSDIPIEATVSFWVIPWRIIGGIIISIGFIAALAIFIYAIIQRRKSKRIARRSFRGVAS
jgi:hypothetical protein